MSKPRPGKIDPEAEKFIIIERPKSNLNPELEKFIIRRPTKPAHLANHQLIQNMLICQSIKHQWKYQQRRKFYKNHLDF